METITLYTKPLRRASLDGQPPWSKQEYDRHINEYLSHFDQIIRDRGFRFDIQVDSGGKIYDAESADAWNIIQYEVPGFWEWYETNRLY